LGKRVEWVRGRRGIELVKKSSEEVGVVDGNGQLNENVFVSEIVFGETTPG